MPMPGSYFEEIVKQDLYKLKDINTCPICKEEEIEITLDAGLSENGRELELHCLCPKCDIAFVYIYKIKRIQVNRV